MSFCVSYEDANLLFSDSFESTVPAASNIDFAVEVWFGRIALTPSSVMPMLFISFRRFSSNISIFAKASSNALRSKTS